MVSNNNNDDEDDDADNEKKKKRLILKITYNRKIYLVQTHWLKIINL